MKYRVIFSGEIAEGKDVEEVKREVGGLFRLDEAKVEQLFTGRKVVIKTDVDHETALKFQQSMEKCGGICQIEEIAAPSVPPAAVEPEAEPEAESAPEPEAVPESEAEAETEPEAESTEEPVAEAALVEQSEPVSATVEDEQEEDVQVPDYDFSISELIKEAWQLTSGAKGTMFGAYGMMLLVSFGLGFVFAILELVAGMVGIPSVAMGIASQLTITIALYPVIAGIVMIGVYRASGLPVSYKMVFAYFRDAVPIILVNILVIVLTLLGMMFLLLPGIYLGVAYTLAVPLVVDRGMGPWEAMELSRRAISRHWFKVFGLYLAMGLISMVSVIPLGVGLIWTIPMAIILNGVLFRTIFGKSVVAAD